MDWASIATAATYGAIGGGVGALLGSLLAAPFRNTGIAKIATTVLTVFGAIVGYNVAEPLLKPYIGQYLPVSSSASAFDSEFESMMEELGRDPLVAAILEREPSLREELKRELLGVAAKAATPATARQMGFSASYNLIVARFNYYLARATNKDLITFMTTTTEVLDGLAIREPRFCYDYLYNPGAMAGLAKDAIKSKIGSDLYDRQQNESGRLVLNAYDQIPEYDVAAAQVRVQEAAVVLRSMLGEAKLGLVNSTLALENDDDAKLACEASAAMYHAILAQENPALAGRHIFVSAAG